VKITEQDSQHQHLEQQPIGQLLQAMNHESLAVVPAITQVLPHLERFMQQLVPRMAAGGRLVYAGAGTSGRLGVLDASECPPTFGVPPGVVVGLIAGGDVALRQAVEGAEDNRPQAEADLLALNPTPQDTLVGISASGHTPYVHQMLLKANSLGLLTAALVCNPDSPMAAAATHPLGVVVGPEFVTGSTRLKAGTAQKMVLNLISTVAMIRLGRVQGNRMVNMQLANDKLVDRGTRYVMEATQLPYEEAQKLLLAHGSVHRALEQFGK
jgi:N-acetylmuramic acid 6-phosphate etherase